MNKFPMCTCCKFRGSPFCVVLCQRGECFAWDRDLVLKMARCNGKTNGLSAKITLVDELHHVPSGGCKSGPYPWGTNVLPKIKDVIFAPPATIVMWSDNTKTVVKAENEDYDPEKGLAMAISRKALGNKHDYYNVFERWLKKYEKDQPYAPVTFNVGISGGFKKAAEAAKKAAESIRKTAVHTREWLACQMLYNAMHDKKATKADLIAAMQGAIDYLEDSTNE